MTAYLISLAVVSLIAIALLESGMSAEVIQFIRKTAPGASRPDGLSHDRISRGVA